MWEFAKDILAGIGSLVVFASVVGLVIYLVGASLKPGDMP